MLNVGTELAPFVQALQRGEVVACPTETLHGLLAAALDAAAVQRVVDLKRRGGDPIALLLPDVAALEQLAADLPARVGELAAQHWPGPLTLLVRPRIALPAPLVRDGKVGVRVPGPSPALQLVRAFGGPLTATSANLSGQPAARTADEVRGYFGGALPAVPGDSPGGAPSTLVDVSDGTLRVLREGAIRL